MNILKKDLIKCLIIVIVVYKIILRKCFVKFFVLVVVYMNW